jgi:hypothetical protein
MREARPTTSPLYYLMTYHLYYIYTIHTKIFAYGLKEKVLLVWEVYKDNKEAMN